MGETATQDTYPIRISEDDDVSSERPGDITVGDDYELGEDLDVVCARVAEAVFDNVIWNSTPRFIDVVIPAASDDPERYEIARGRFTVATD